MNKMQLTVKLKQAGMTAAEIGVVTGSMILTKKFLDFNMLFKNKIAKDPKFSESFIIKHQGGVRFGLGLAAAVYFQNPWVKLIFLGVAAEGAITEIRTLTTDSTGVSFFDKIGAADTRVDDAELLQMAAQYDNTMGAMNPTTMYPTGTGAINPTTEFPTSVAGYNQSAVNLSESIPMYTAGSSDNDYRPYVRIVA